MNDFDWLSALNLRLLGIEEDPCPGKPAHNLFIIGAPRSGTTILNQCLAACFDVGYVDNLMACFWNAPAYGARLSAKLITQRGISSRSEFGRTSSVADPHEFGAFWRSRLGYDDMVQRLSVDSEKLNLLSSELDIVSSVFGKPVVYKVFQLIWHMADFHKIKPESRWLWIERDVVDNALSILNMRESLRGDRSLWVSSRSYNSLELKFESYYHEVIYQVLSINKWIAGQVGSMPNGVCMKVDYEKFVACPEHYLPHFSEFFGVKVKPDFLGFLDGIVNPVDRGRQNEDRILLQNALEHIERQEIW